MSCSNNKPIRKVNFTFTQFMAPNSSVALKVVKLAGCEGCYFKPDAGVCKDINGNIRNLYNTGMCSETYRGEGQGVVFIKIKEEVLNVSS